MAKEIRFSLLMEDGTYVSDIESLRDHFSLNSIRGYYHDGRLMDWLTEGFYSEEVDILRGIKDDDPELDMKLCQLIEVPYMVSQNEEDISIDNVNNLYSGSSEYITCSCGNRFLTEQLLCNKCGKLLQKISFRTPNESIPVSLTSSEYDELSQLSSFIAGEAWKDGNMKYREISREIETAKKIAAFAQKRIKNPDEEDRSVYRWIYKKCRKFIVETEERAVEVAIVGNVKSGKSSLINALLGGKMASVDPTPETSVLVKYRATDEKNYVRVGFYSDIEWTKLWNSVKKANAKSGNVFENEYKRLGSEKLRAEYVDHKPIYVEATQDTIYDEIYKWTCSESPEHFFVKEVEVGYQGDIFPKDVVLVDTPGLRDPIEFRSRITRNYINRSDWVLACITSDNLSSQDEADFLCKVVANKKEINNILVVATKKDMLTSSANEKKQDEFIQRMAPIYGNAGNVKKHFVAISSELFSFTDRTKNGGQLQQEEMQTMVQGLVKLNMYDFSAESVRNHWEEIDSYAGISELMRRINELFLLDRRKHIIREVKQNYARLIGNIRAKTEERLSEENHDLTMLIDKSEESKELRKQLQDDLDELEVQRNQVVNLLDQISKARKLNVAEEN